MPPAISPCLVPGVDASVSFFTETMGDPKQPIHCAECLWRSIHHINHVDGGAAYVSRNHHSILNLCMAVLTLPRSPAEAMSLIGRWDVRSCARDSKTLPHPHLCTEKTDYAHELVAEMIVLVHDALIQPDFKNDVHRVKRLSRRAARAGQGAPWPRPRDLLPLGAERSLEGLLAFLDLTAFRLQGSIVPFLAAVIKSAGLHVTRHLTKSRALAELLPRMIHSCCEQLHTPAFDHSVLGMSVRDPLLMRTGHIADLCLELVDRSDEGALVNFFRMCKPEDDLARACSRAVCALETFPTELLAGKTWKQDTFDRAHGAFLEVGAFVHSRLALPPDRARYHLDLIRVSHSLLAARADPVYGAAVAYEQLGWSSRCAAPGCPKTYFDAERAFGKCAGCAVARYCSTACQRSAWRHPHAPHRELCPVLRKIVGFPAGPDEILAEGDVLKILRWGAVFCATVDQRGADELWAQIARWKAATDTPVGGALIHRK